MFFSLIGRLNKDKNKKIEAPKKKSRLIIIFSGYRTNITIPAATSPRHKTPKTIISTTLFVCDQSIIIPSFLLSYYK